MTEPSARVLIAGHGQMGRAFETLLRGRAVTHVWEVAPGRVTLIGADREAAAHAGVVFLCVPTQALATVVAPLLGGVPAAAAAVSIAKGLDEGGASAAEILQRTWQARPWGVLGGPMVAADICAGRLGYAEFGSRHDGLAGRLHALFAGSALRFRALHAPRAVSWCGVLKNVYALVIGLTDGLNFGANVRGHLLMGAAAELRDFLAGLGEDPAAGLGEAGLADLVATVSSPDSHHYNLGRALARGEAATVECEGMHSLRVLAPHLDARAYPLLAVASGLLESTAAARRRLHGWLEREEPAG